MTPITKRVIALALSGALLMPAVSAAEAGPRHGWNDHRGGWNHHRNDRRHERRHDRHRDHGKRHKNNAGAAVAAGIIGLAAGAILLGAVNQPRRAAPASDYYPPAPYPGRVSGYGYQPWSPAWYDYCASKYRSFNPSTGTYTTYRGEQRFCQ